jgi:hypothetical protein
MKAGFPILLLAAVSWAQTPAATPAATAIPHASPLGYTYSLPSDWEVVDPHPMEPLMKQQQAKTAESPEEKKGIECVQLALTARKGSPASVIVVVELPFSCFGQTMTEKDLPGFAMGASDGLKKSFNITDPQFGAYTLGKHSFWIERVQGSVIDHPEAAYTVEIACTLLKDGAVCWMAMAKDTGALEAFEHGAVTLDGENEPALVPANAFEKKATP